MKTLWKEGLDECLNKGEAKGKAESILMILEARGMPAPKEVEGHIRACRDQDLLGQWLLKALRVTSAHDLFA